MEQLTLFGPLRTCELCSRGYVPRTKWQRTCSYECGYTLVNRRHAAERVERRPRRLCQRCGAVLPKTKRGNAVYCSINCKLYEGNFRRRTKDRAAGSRVGRPTRRQVIERDRSTCYLCGLRLSWGEVQIDHVVPVARGGSGMPANLAVTCGSCNRVKHTSVGVAQVKRLVAMRGLE